MTRKWGQGWSAYKSSLSTWAGSLVLATAEEGALDRTDCWRGVAGQEGTWKIKKGTVTEEQFGLVAVKRPKMGIEFRWELISVFFFPLELILWPEAWVVALGLFGSPGRCLGGTWCSECGQGIRIGRLQQKSSSSARDWDPEGWESDGAAIQGPETDKLL